MKNTDKILKLICGAGNEDFEEIEKLSFIYASAGFNMIDTSACIEAVNAVKEGIKKAGKEGQVKICVSIGLQGDIHVSKAVIDETKCAACGKCAQICPQNAVIETGSRFFIDEKKCIGCGKCIKICLNRAVKAENKYSAPEKMLLPLLNAGIDCVEFHCTSENENEILESWEKIKSIYSGQLSICMNRLKLGDERIISLLKRMTEGMKDVIIQADGNPMTGGKDDYKSNLQAAAFAELIINSKINAEIILSGGTNSKTAEFARLCSLDISGIAIGSYARKLVKEYTKDKNFMLNTELQRRAVLKASQLAEKINN